MRLVADSSSIMSALIKDSSSRKIINESSIKCVIPEHVLTEIEKHREELCSKSGMDSEKLDLLLALMKERIEIIPDTEIIHKEEAQEVMDKIDPNDTIFIALALSVKNDGIWSDDKHFEKQTKIKVWKTSDLVKYGSNPDI